MEKRGCIPEDHKVNVIHVEADKKEKHKPKKEFPNFMAEIRCSWKSFLMTYVKDLFHPGHVAP